MGDREGEGDLSLSLSLCSIPTLFLPSRNRRRTWASLTSGPPPAPKSTRRSTGSGSPASIQDCATRSYPSFCRATETLTINIGCLLSDGDGRLTGTDAIKFFGMSNLPRPDLKQMAQKAVTGLTADKIALTEKVDMTLDGFLFYKQKLAASSVQT